MVRSRRRGNGGSRLAYSERSERHPVIVVVNQRPSLRTLVTKPEVLHDVLCLSRSYERRHRFSRLRELVCFHQKQLAFSQS